MPQEYTGGLGAKAAANLKTFAEQGGTLVFLNRSANYAVEHLHLDVKNVVAGVSNRDFYSPGSLLNATLDTQIPLLTGCRKTSRSGARRALLGRFLRGAKTASSSAIRTITCWRPDGCSVNHISRAAPRWSTCRSGKGAPYCSVSARNTARKAIRRSSYFSIRSFHRTATVRERTTSCRSARPSKTPARRRARLAKPRTPEAYPYNDAGSTK